MSCNLHPCSRSSVAADAPGDVSHRGEGGVHRVKSGAEFAVSDWIRSHRELACFLRIRVLNSETAKSKNLKFVSVLWPYRL